MKKNCAPSWLFTKSKVKVHPRTGHKGPEIEQRYSYTLSLTSAIDGVGGQRHAPAALPPVKRPDTHCIGAWVGLMVDLDGAENLTPTGIRSPDRPACSDLLY
jgi:hypothetical protein